MQRDKPYKVKSFDLHGLQGISDRTLDVHFSLYEGYVKAANALTGEIGEFLKDGQVDQEEMPAYSELTRRLGFEYNGMVLHEYVWEHAFLLDYPPSKRGDYIEAFFANVDWKAVDRRVRGEVLYHSGAA